MSRTSHVSTPTVEEGDTKINEWIDDAVKDGALETPSVHSSTRRSASFQQKASRRKSKEVELLDDLALIERAEAQARRRTFEWEDNFECPSEGETIPCFHEAGLNQHQLRALYYAMWEWGFESQLSLPDFGAIVQKVVANADENCYTVWYSQFDKDGDGVCSTWEVLSGIYKTIADIEIKIQICWDFWADPNAKGELMQELKAPQLEKIVDNLCSCFSYKSVIAREHYCKRQVELMMNKKFSDGKRAGTDDEGHRFVTYQQFRELCNMPEFKYLYTYFDHLLSNLPEPPICVIPLLDIPLWCVPRNWVPAVCSGNPKHYNQNNGCSIA